MIEFLEWDSNFFNLKIGKAQFSRPNFQFLNLLLNAKVNERYDLIYFFCDEIDFENEKLIFDARGQLVDLKVTYQQTLCSNTINCTPAIESYSGDITNELFALTLASGYQSRFKKDPRLSPLYEQLYKQWIIKSLSGDLADAVLVHYSANNITGFVTVRNNKSVGQIGLIAVNERERGKGIGGQLIIAANAWYQTQNIQESIVVTQKDNQQACKLYEKYGYSIQSIERIYHI